MPGARLKTKPESAYDYLACNEESQLELHLQRQLEEDVARIFDESIYSDLEVVCGRLKVLTHSCILKARTEKFYHKLQTILHVNIGRNTFDEIYSFISDAYTECNIKHQEKEIITYLDTNFNIVESTSANSCEVKEILEEPEVFLTPKCISPYIEQENQKSINPSPSTELTKEYYALVPIDRNLLDKELIEQDALSNAFHSIIKAQVEDTNPAKVAQRNKPTSLSLSSSHISKTIKHSNSCDILNEKIVNGDISSKSDNHLEKNNINNTTTSQNSKSNQFQKENFSKDSSIEKKYNNCDTYTEKTLDPAYSPDSLVTDEPSSSSDYLSAAYTCSPGVSLSGFVPQLNVGINTAKMENIFTLSDSGLENTAMLGSINSHKDITLTDVSFSESTLHDLVNDDASNTDLDEKNNFDPSRQSTSSEKDYNWQNTSKTILKEMSGKSSKEEKQRQNEEIVILESSSLSSETGSWESVYPPKFPEKDVCENFLSNERQYSLIEQYTVTLDKNKTSPSLVKKSPFKSTSCFIDAASLVDEDDETLQIQSINNETLGNDKLDLPERSQPVPCSTVKLDMSPNDWSEGNDNEDSLEQADKKDPDSIQKDLSPTIFEMTPITEDSLCANAFESAIQPEHDYPEKTIDVGDGTNYISDKDQFLRSSTIFMSSTPNNSIMSLKTFKQLEEEENKQVEGTEECVKNQSKESHSPPILSGGVSIEDHLPQLSSSRENSPLPKWKLDNAPIVSGAYVSKPTESNTTRARAQSASAWVVDMSIDPKTNESLNASSKNSEENVSEKKNIFSMYIDLGEKSTLKDMPARLSSSINLRKQSSNSEIKSTVKNVKAISSKINSSNFSTDHDISHQSVTIFEKYESLCNDPNISISEIIGLPEKRSTIPEITEEINLDSDGNEKPALKLTTNDDCTSSLETITIKEESATTDLQTSDLFVKLSDLDKPVQKSDTSLINATKEMNMRMTRSIPDNNWCEQALSANSKSIEVISSFHSENALSLNRLFPHLKNEFSRSMPGSLSSRTRSPLRLGTSSTLGDGDEQPSDMSEVSSMQSSICRSGFGNSTTDSQTSSLIENCTSRLGQDLLRMFLEEIAPDVIVEVSGKRFKAHKCILSSRCQYFAGILSGGWVESLGNVIVLPPFSYNVVYFALCHIYSGLATIPDSVSIVELATIADMLGLEGLKEAIMFTLKAKYCHHFHKPCAVCIVGVLECFPLSSVYGLDDLYHKCLKWITKHFSKVWPTKAFATLPTDLLDKCYQQHIVNLTVENFVETVYGCGVTAASLQNSRWAENVARMCRRLINAAAHFAALRLMAVFQAITSLPCDTPHAAKQALDDCLAAAIDWAPPDEACRAYAFLSALIKDMRSQHYSKPDLISNGTESIKATGSNNLLYTHAGSWRLRCEGALVRDTPRVVATQAFKDLPSELRKRLRELGCIMYGPQAISVTPSTPLQDRRSRSAYHSKTSKASCFSTRSVDIAHVRASFVPYSSKPVIPVGSVDRLRSNNDLRDVKKMANSVPPKVRTTKAQEERAKFNKYKNNKSQERLNGKTVTARAPSFENTKPRYLDPKTSKEKKMPAVRKLFPKIESSSESSRNSSPIQIRNLKMSSLKPRQAETEAQAMSQDSLATSSRPRTAEPSTDSLSESQTSNKYATYTKAKHATKGSIESIKSSKCHNSVVNSKPLNQNNKMKTKIPVYLNQTKPKTVECKNVKDGQKRNAAVNKICGSASNKSVERKPPGSLMNATKSSSAKMVPKVVKEASCSKTTKTQKSTHVSRHHRHEEAELPRDIPIMERSGTFLKDEPTFGDKTTNIDIGKSEKGNSCSGTAESGAEATAGRERRRSIDTAQLSGAPCTVLVYTRES